MEISVKRKMLSWFHKNIYFWFSPSGIWQPLGLETKLRPNTVFSFTRLKLRPYLRKFWSQK